MRVGIDAANLRQGGGITHIRELLEHAKPGDADISEVLVWGGASTLEQLPDKKWLRKVPLPFLNGSPVRLAYWRWCLLPRRARQDCDLLFVPGGSECFGFRPVVTMSRNLLPFDARLIRQYGWSLRALRLWMLRFQQTIGFKRADGVIFLTNFARKSISKQVGRFRGQIVEIPHGISPGFLSPPRKQRLISECAEENPFIWTYVSTITKYKNQGAVISAFARLRAKGLPVKLLLIGPGDSTALAELEASTATHDPDGAFVEFLGPRGRAEIQEILGRSDASLFASSCENMPNILLECMAAGLPIACSRLGPMPEVLGDAGLFFDPEDDLDIMGAVERMTLDASLRAKLALNSFGRSSQYTWTRCAEETLAFLRQSYESYTHGSSNRTIVRKAKLSIH